MYTVHIVCVILWSGQMDAQPNPDQMYKLPLNSRKQVNPCRRSPWRSLHSSSFY